MVTVGVEIKFWVHLVMLGSWPALQVSEGLGTFT